MLNEDEQMVPAMHRQPGMQAEKSDTLGQIPRSYARREGEKMEIPRYVRARTRVPCLPFASAQPWPTFKSAIGSAKRPQRTRSIRSVRMIADLCSSDASHHRRLPSRARLRW